MTIIPPYLHKGDTIGIICPSGFMPMDKVETCITVLKEWGYKVKIGSTVGNQYHYFSGTDEERLADLQSMTDTRVANKALTGSASAASGLAFLWAIASRAMSYKT